MGFMSERRAYLDPHFPQWLGCEQCTDLSDNGAVKTTDHNPISFSQDTVRKNNIDSCAQSLDDLDFENCTLELRQVHQAVAHSLLSKVDQQHDHIRHTLSCDSRCRDEGHVPCEVLIFVVQTSIQPFFGEGDDCLRHTIFEFALNGSTLLGE